MRINRHAGSLIFLMLTFFFVAAITQTDNSDKYVRNYDHAFIDTVAMQVSGKMLYMEACAGHG